MLADCIQKEGGRSLTPIALAQDIASVFPGGIALDFCSDEVANQALKAERWYGFVEDGFAALSQLDSLVGRVWLQPPGVSYTGGSESERRMLWDFLNLPENYYDPAFEGNPANPFTKYSIKMEKVEGRWAEPSLYIQRCLSEMPSIRKVTAIEWYRALYDKWNAYLIREALVMVYRSGSFNALPGDMINASLWCFTNPMGGSPLVNKSGRLGFDDVENGQRVTKNSNTQGSVIGLLPSNADQGYDFRKALKGYGVFMLGGS